LSGALAFRAPSQEVLTLGSNPKLENKDGYKRINRYADITYSGVFNSSSNVNKLNEFNLSANF
jgi:hypothetical protein